MLSSESLIAFLKNPLRPASLAPHTAARVRASAVSMSDQGSRPPRPGSTLLFRIMNPELFYAVPGPVLAVGAAVVAVACANTARLVGSVGGEDETGGVGAVDDDDGAPPPP
ncbi:hypothetical protein N9D08_00710 [bacterium]|nr:hypothetical protein [bacterium]